LSTSSKEQTKREIQRLWKTWPQRKEYKGHAVAPLVFYEWLEATEQAVIYDGFFGPGDPCQMVKIWCEDWEKRSDYLD
jgi:hypothetical protein